MYQDDLITFKLFTHGDDVFLSSTLVGEPKLSDFKRWLWALTELDVELEDRGYTRVLALVATEKDKRWNEFLGAREIGRLEDGSTIMMKEYR